MRSLFLTWVKKLMRLAPISSIAMELVRFDLQQSQNPEISGVQHQQGELQGYEVREYLLEKFNYSLKLLGTVVVKCVVLSTHTQKGWLFLCCIVLAPHFLSACRLGKPQAFIRHVSAAGRSSP